MQWSQFHLGCIYLRAASGETAVAGGRDGVWCKMVYHIYRSVWLSAPLPTPPNSQTSPNMQRAREQKAVRLKGNNFIYGAAGTNKTESARKRTCFALVILTVATLSGTWIAVLYHVSQSINGSVLPEKNIRLNASIRRQAREAKYHISESIVDLSIDAKRALPEEVLNHPSPYTAGEIEKNKYLGWQPKFPSPNASFSWRKCFSIRPTAPVSKLPKECREHPDDFGPAPKIDKNWIPDVTMVRTMLMYGKDRDGNVFPPPLDREFCEDIAVMGGKYEDTNKQCLVESNIQPTGPLNATTVTIDPSNHYGVAGTSKPIIVDAPSIICLVYTMADAHSSRIQGMRDTWAGGCDGFLAFSTESDPRLPAISLKHDGPEEYDNMWQKVRSIWKFVGTHYLDDYDWFFIGGDDLFVLPHNLKTYLASLVYKDKADPKTDEYYVGRRFKEWGETPFNSGGAGYAMSQATLRKLLTVIDDEVHCSARKHTCESIDCLSFNLKVDNNLHELPLEYYYQL